MIHFESIALGSLSTNAYVVKGDDPNKAVIIDPGMKPAALIRRIADLEVEAILLTHAHFDHMAGLEEIRKLKGNPPVYLHDLEADWLGSPKKNGSALWPEIGGDITAEPAEFALEDGQQLKLLGHTFRVLHTPGHSPGSVSFLVEGHLFCGDVLFRLGVGRTDLYGGSDQDLHDSLHEKLFTLDDAVIVHPGHGPKTTISFERDNNPYA